MSDTSRAKPITETTIPGTKVPDVTKVDAADAESKRFMSRVAVTTAVLATLASIATMFSTSHLNQAMLDQIKSADQWSFFQAKGVKLAVLESKMELLKELRPDSAAEAAKPGADPARPPAETDAQRAARYASEQAKVKDDAKALEESAADHRRRHVTLGRSSTAFQVAIALSAIALLVKKPVLWWISLALGLVGSAYLAQGLL